MKVIVATDAHIYQTPDGKHWTPAIYGYSFWTRYLNEFDEIRVVARTKFIDSIDGINVLPVDGPGVEIFPIPFFQGPKQMMRVYMKIHRKLRGVTNGCSVAILRMPSQTAQMVYSHVKGKMPIGGEIVYDPTDDLKRIDVSMTTRLIDHVISAQLRSFCMSANGVAYVTKDAIQKNYPSRARKFGQSSSYFETYYSTITLSDEAFSSPKDFSNINKLTIGFSDVSMNSGRKGEKIVIDAVSIARSKGYPIDAILIGDGIMRPEFEAYARQKGVADSIVFTGRFASAENVREVLKNTDLYMFPSQAEGLPRGILEAMALGLPVLSTPVGGIPEVIEKKYLFAPQDSDGFANMLMRLFDNRSELNAVSKRNYQKAQEFNNRVLQQKRDRFYSQLKGVKL